MTTDSIPAGPAAALAERLFHDVIGALELFTVYLGERLGLYRALAAGFRSVEVLPLQTETWRFYRITP